MRRRLPLVDRLRVRTPCDVGWSNMEERGRDRHCAQCELTVHDIASMTRAEVETLLEARERGQRVCLHLHVRRSDGAVLVADGHVERVRRSPSPPSRLMAAAMATAVTACSMKAPPPEAPSAVIAVGEATPSPIETRPPDPPPIEAPLPVTAATAPSMPEPARPVKIDHPKKIASPPPKTPPSKKHYVELDGDAW